MATGPPRIGRSREEDIFGLSPPYPRPTGRPKRPSNPHAQLKNSIARCKLTLNRGNSAASLSGSEICRFCHSNPNSELAATSEPAGFVSAQVVALISCVRIRSGGSMWRVAAFCLGVCLSLPASAATLDAVQGQVLINHGKGFQRVAPGTEAREGDLVMANPGGSAKLIYPGGCVTEIKPGSCHHRQ